MLPKHSQEEERLAALHRYGILDTPVEEDYEDITRLAAYICQSPIAVINLIDRDRQWFKSEIGLGVRETPLDISICAHALLQPGLFIVPDTLEDVRFACNRLVTGQPHLRFYAGALLESSDGYPLGTLCILDYTPRELTDTQKQSLQALSRQVMKLIELQRSSREVALLNERLLLTITESHHRIKNSLQVIAALIEMQRVEETETISPSAMHRLSHHVQAISTIHDLLTEQARAGATETSISAAAALNKLIPILQGMMSGQRLHAQVEEMPLSVKQASSLTLLVNELISNAVKHGGQGDIEISLTTGDGQARLEVQDSGKGFPDDFDPRKAANTGLDLIETLSRHDLRGNIAYLNRAFGSGGRVSSHSRFQKRLLRQDKDRLLTGSPIAFSRKSSACAE